MNRTCADCGTPIYLPRQVRCARCAPAYRKARQAARWRALTPEERDDRRYINRLKYAAERPERLCTRCLKPDLHPYGRATTCDNCCGKRNLQKRLNSRAARARHKADKDSTP